MRRNSGDGARHMVRYVSRKGSHAKLRSRIDPRIHVIKESLEMARSALSRQVSESNLKAHRIADEVTSREGEDRLYRGLLL